MIETSGNDELRREIVANMLAYGYEPWLGNADWNGVAKVMNLTPEQARGQYRRLLNWLDEYGYSIEEYVGELEWQPLVTEIEEIREESRFDKLVDATGINRELFEVDKGSIWGSMHNMSASFKFRRRAVPTQLQIEKLIDGLKKDFPTFEPIERKSGNYMAIISLYDIQLGRLGAFGTAGTIYTIEKYEDILNQLLESASQYPLEEVVLVLGNDYADADNPFGTTTKGTPQPQDMHWRYSIDEQCEVATDTIHKLRTVAPVRVIMVGGNHDMYSNYWLGKYVEAYFAEADDVIVNNLPRYRKFYRYGNTSFMFTHGNEERLISLPAIFMKEGGVEMASAPFNEVHTGHFHQRKDTWQVLTEEYGVYIRVLPSLSPSNDWEDLKGFILHNRGGIAHVYHKSKGQVAEFYGKI